MCCKQLRACVSVVLWAAIVSASVSAADPPPILANWHVDDDFTGKADGTVLRPFRTVQQAIAAAQDSDVIAVAAGTYSQNISVREKAVKLYGGFVGGTAESYARGEAGDFKTRDPAANVSHLKGNGKDSVVTLFEAGATIVDGFRVSGGGRSQVAAPSWLGGGFYIYAGSPTLANNVIEDNHTCPRKVQDEEKLGGGIYATGAKIAILDNLIRNNTAGRGAGVAADCPRIVLKGNTVQGNVGVSDHGGGLYLFSNDATISYNQILENEIGRALGYGWGGGVIVFNKGGSYKFSHNVFTGNFAPSVGSALFVDDGAVASLENDLIFANACNPAGNGAVPAVYVDGSDAGPGSTLKINHTTIADHVCKPTVPGNAINVTGKSQVIITNSILWNNGGDDVEADATSKFTASYTLAQEKLKGTGNLSADPLFVDASKRDYRLRSLTGRWDAAASNRQGAWVRDAQQSPAIDAADPKVPFDREPEPHGGRANLGADGNTPQAGKSRE